jgi:hypothetical protein
MDEGSLVGIIGHQPRARGRVTGTPVLDIDRLEILGKPLEVAA